ncbi:MAG: DUF4258 domain-containing protein [Candidatus Vecturithrix sp.]|nr:DUF4258 domain-containing protein [Candidatus Vecturithrix sp.]
MSRRILRQIRNALHAGNYDMTYHGVEEMAEDWLGIGDVEHAILTGSITKTEVGDPRGTKYTIVGLAEDGSTKVGIVGRFKETRTFLIITIYEVTE